MSSLRVRARKDGTSFTTVTWREDGTQKGMSFDDHGAALRWKSLLDQVGPAHARKVTRAEQDHVSGPTLTEWITTFIDSLTGIEEGTRTKYRSYLKRDIEPVIGHLPLAAVNEMSISTWVQSLTGAGKTISNKHGFLSHALSGAVRAGLVESNPCEGRRLPRTVKPEMVFLTPEEFKILLSHMPVKWRALTVWLVCTGMRFGEATALKVGDIDTANATCRITRAWKYTGKSIRTIGPPKSRKSIRTINLPAQALEVVDVSRDPDEWLFVNSVGKPVLSQLYGNTGWIPAVKLATDKESSPRITRKPRIHDLRHSCASWMIAAGVPLPVIQQHMGHESISTTVDIYGHLDRTAAQVASSAVSEALGSF